MNFWGSTHPVIFILYMESRDLVIKTWALDHSSDLDSTTHYFSLSVWIFSGRMEGSERSLLIPVKASPLPGLGVKKKKLRRSSLTSFALETVFKNLAHSLSKLIVDEDWDSPNSKYCAYSPTSNPSLLINLFYVL